MPPAAVSSISFFSLPFKSLLKQFARAGVIASVLFLASLSLPSEARAWGCEGHQVVALLAEKHLTPHALAMVKKILADSPIDPNLSRSCKEGGVDPLALR
jgi:hypothetical protein